MGKILISLGLMLSLVSCQVIQGIANDGAKKVGDAVEKELDKQFKAEISPELQEQYSCAAEAVKHGDTIRSLAKDREEAGSQKFSKETLQDICKVVVSQLDHLAQFAPDGYKCLGLLGTGAARKVGAVACESI